MGAAGDCIKQHGDRFVAYKKNEHYIGIDYKVADVKRPVLSISNAVDKGKSWVFTPSGSYMIPRAIEFSEPDAIKLVRRNDLFFMRMDGYTESDSATVMPVHRDEPVVEAPTEKRTLVSCRACCHGEHHRRSLGLEK